MIPSTDRQAELCRMEEACRQTRHKLDMIERQIIGKMTGFVLSLGRRTSGYTRGRPPEPAVFLSRYCSNLAATTAERQPEIDAVSRKLARHEAAIAACRQSLGVAKPRARKRGEIQRHGDDQRSRTRGRYRSGISGAGRVLAAVPSSKGQDLPRRRCGRAQAIDCRKSRPCRRRAGNAPAGRSLIGFRLSPLSSGRRRGAMPQDMAGAGRTF